MKNPLASFLKQLLCPEYGRIEEYLKHFAMVTSNAEACVLGNQRLTYNQLFDKVETCAGALQKKGIVPGDFVVTHAPPGIGFLVTFLATQVCGATWVGLNPKHKREELSYVLQDAKPKVAFVREVIGERNYVEDFIAIQKDLAADIEIISLENIAEHSVFLSYSSFVKDSQSPLLPSEPSKNSMMVYTSGSTGQPKGALLPHTSLIRAARIRHSVWHRRPMRTLLNIPINHIGGAGDITCTTLIGGGTLVCMEKYDPLETLKIIEKEKLTFLYQTPTQLQMTFFLPEVNDYNYESLEAVVWSGARASQPLIERLSSYFEGKLATDYSMTESVGAVTMTPLTDDKNVLGNSVGWAVPDRQVTIQQESGEITVQDGFIMSGYYNRPEASKLTINENGLLHTGDIGKILSNGAITLTGRMSNMFKSGGYNVYPAEIEMTLESHEAIISAVVVSAPDDLWGETGHAFLIAESDKSIDISEVKEYCQSKLANYKVPKSFQVVENMPKLAIGKIDLAALKSQIKI